jgi:hypothetical protein
MKDYGGPVAMRRNSYPIDRDDYNATGPRRANHLEVMIGYGSVMTTDLLK